MYVRKAKTIANSVSITGKGLHSGVDVLVTIIPAEPDFGYQFVRTDLENRPVINALASNVVSTARGTTLQENGAQVMTIEHLLAALFGMDIDNALIEVSGPEIPILNGSSKPYVELIEAVGLKEQKAERTYYEIKEKLPIPTAKALTLPSIPTIILA